MLRANPIDGVVLLGGCDKTIPSLLMAAASVNLPAVVVPGGPMLTGTLPRDDARLRNRRVATVGGGARWHPRRTRLHRIGVVDDPQHRTLQHHGHGIDDGGDGRGARHDAHRNRWHAGGGQSTSGAVTCDGPTRRRTGRRRSPTQPRHDTAAFANAIVALAAIGGSTNAVCTCSPSPAGSAST